jgi:hypothetical protein
MIELQIVNPRRMKLSLKVFRRWKKAKEIEESFWNLKKIFSSFKISLETFREFDEFTPTEGGCGRQQDFVYLLFHNDTR